MKSKPLIYLDSSDFIRLTDERHNSEVEDIFQYLCEKKDLGECDFGLSYLHIIEVLNPDSAGYEKSQEKYGRTMGRLVSGAFPHISDLLKGARFPNDGVWFPLETLQRYKTVASEASVNKIIKSQIKEHTKLGRRNRNKLKNKRFLTELIKSSTFEVPQQFKFLGVTQEDMKNLILQPVRYRRSFYRKLTSSLLNLEQYSRIVAVAKPGENPLLNSVNSEARPIHDSILKTIELVREAELLRKSIIDGLDKKLSDLTDLGLGGSESAKELRDMKKKVKKEKFPKVSDRDQRFRTPRFQFLDHYMKSVPRMDKIPAFSEVKDILHLLYAHDVDLIRTDRRMAEVMKGELSIGRKIVGKLTELPACINSLIQP